MSLMLGRFCFSYRSCLWRSLSGYQETLDRLHCPGLWPQVTSLHTSAIASAGHNKWSKVKHIKGPKDEARARLFAKLTMMIKVVVKEGGPNPDFNSHLYQLVEQARQRNMPKNSIEAAIKGAEKSKPTSYALYQARGPGGCSLVIELLTDNTSRSFADIRMLLNKNGGTHTDVLHCFNKKGVVTIQTQDKDGKPVQLEQALNWAIEAGAEDVQEMQDEEEEKDVYKYICEFSSLRDVRSQLISFGLVPIFSGPEYLPSITVQLSDTDKERVFKLLELIKDQPDVMRVYDNIE